MKLSDLLRWGHKKTESEPSGAVAWARDRRQAHRGVTGAGWLYWASETGEAQRARISFAESADASSLRFRVSKSLSAGAVCWAVPDAGKAFPCQIAAVEKLEQGSLASAACDFQDHFTSGHTGSRLEWVDDDRTVLSLPATVKNSGQGLIEIAVPANVPARRMILLEGPHYGCLAVCRGSRPDGSRFILVAEAASDSFATATAAA